MMNKRGQLNPRILTTLGGFAIGYSISGLDGGFIGAIVGFFIWYFV